MRGGVDPPRELRFRPRVVGFVDVWKDFRSGDGNLSSPGCAGSMFEPKPISDRPMGLTGVSIPCGVVGPGG